MERERGEWEIGVRKEAEKSSRRGQAKMKGEAELTERERGWERELEGKLESDRVRRERKDLGEINRE